MKTEEYSSLPPEIQQIHLQHWLAHKQQAVLEMQHQQMMQQVAMGPQMEQAPGEGQPVSQRNGAGQ